MLPRSHVFLREQQLHRFDSIAVLRTFKLSRNGSFAEISWLHSYLFRKQFRVYSLIINLEEITQ